MRDKVEEVSKRAEKQWALEKKLQDSIEKLRK
jgi:hypothetical protein